MRYSKASTIHIKQIHITTSENLEDQQLIYNGFPKQFIPHQRKLQTSKTPTIRRELWREKENIKEEKWVGENGRHGGREGTEISLDVSAILYKTSYLKNLYVLCNTITPEGSIEYPSFFQLFQPWH